MNTIKQLERARKVGTPLVAIGTADQPATLAELAKMPEPERGKTLSPVIAWDLLRGFTAANTEGENVIGKLTGDAQPVTFRSPGAALAAGHRAANKTVIVMFNAQRLLQDPVMAQGIMNLREPFKSTGRTLVLLGPSFDLPPELAHDVLVLDEPNPTREEISASLDKLYGDNEIVLTDDLRVHAIDALAGLPAFPIESAASLAVQDDGTVDLEEMWRRKERAVGNVKGLKMTRPKIGFEAMGGLREFKRYCEDLKAGPCPPRVIVWLDEFDRMISGAGGDGRQGESSGTSADAVKVLLTDMERYGWVGDLRPGPAGTGKTFSVSAMAAYFGIPMVEADLGAAKSKWVGESERLIRDLTKMLLAIGGEGPGVYFAATMNQLDTLSAPMRRRFSANGSAPFYFDLPDDDERETIGQIQLDFWGKLAGRDLAPGVHGPIAVPSGARFFRQADGWSGANIRDCCRVAYTLRKTIDQITIVPAAQQDATGLERLRQMAKGVFLSASYPGTYKLPSERSEPASRKFARRGE